MSERGTLPPGAEVYLSEAERAAYQCIAKEGDRASALFERLRAIVPAEHFDLLNEFDAAKNGIPGHVAALIVARIQRWCPYLTDLLELAGPNGMEMRDTYP